MKTPYTHSTLAVILYERIVHCGYSTAQDEDAELAMGLAEYVGSALATMTAKERRKLIKEAILLAELAAEKMRIQDEKRRRESKRRRVRTRHL